MPMRPSSFPRAALACLYGLALAAAVGPATAQVAAPAGTAGPLDAGRYVERTETGQAATVAGVYRDALANALADDWRSDPAGLQTLLADPGRFRFMTFRSQWDVTTPGPEGRWHFVTPAVGERWPDGAVRTLDRSTAERFDVERIVHCSADAGSCVSVQALAGTLPIPRPSFGPDAASTAQWRRHIESRACTPGPASTPAPPYPASARARGAGGTVVLGLLVDPCGQVHDAWVESTSGVTEFDRAAVRTAQRWRVAMPAAGSEPGRGATLRVPISFQPEPPDPTAAP